MWLVLCEATDSAALWAYAGLMARGLTPLGLVSVETLAASLLWEHRLSDSKTSTNIRLADGREFRSDTLRGVLNRVVTPSMALWRSAKAADRDYVLQELTAFYLSWLYALPCPVLNRPTPQGLSGQWRHESDWVWLATQAGLQIPAYRETSTDPIDESKGERRLLAPATPVKTVIVVSGQPVGASAPPNVLEGCCRLARLAGTALLGVEFTAADSSERAEWTFVGATPMPDLSLGGPALLDVLAGELQAGQRL